MKSKSKQNSGFLGAVERIGAKFPHPVVLFLWLTLIVFVLSFVCSIAGVTAIHPSTGDVIEPVNLISKYGFRVFLKEFVENFQAFPVLGVVVVMGAITGLCEKTGLLTTFIRVSVSKLNGTMVVLLFAFISVFSKMAGDVCQIIMPIIGAAMFYELGRHPLAGAFCGYAASSAGFAATIIPGSGEVTLTPVVISAAQLLMPEYDLTAIGAYYGLLVNAIVITVVTTIITIKVVEPRLGKYEGTPEDLDSAASSAVTDVERKALKKAGLALLIYLAVLVVLCIPQGSIFRNDETGSLLVQGTLLSSLNVLVGLFFLVPGVTYGVYTNQIKKFGDVISFMTEAVKGLSGFIVMAIFIGQFLRAFSESKLGQIIGIKGGELLGSANLPMWLIIILFLLLVAFINIFMASCMSKFLIMAPIFIPMLMRLNINPAFTFWVYRMGDGCTNLITPLDAVFVALLTTIQKYDKKANMGTILSYEIPYAAAYFVAFAVVAVLWMVFDIPVGVGGTVFLN